MDGRTTDAVKTALKALQRANGITSRELQEVTGWGARPNGTFLTLLASRHDFRHTQTKVDGIYRHKFTPKSAVATRATTKSTARDKSTPRKSVPARKPAAHARSKRTATA